MGEAMPDVMQKSSARIGPGAESAPHPAPGSPVPSGLTLGGILASWLACAGVKATYQGMDIQHDDLVSENGILPYVVMRASLLSKEIFGVPIPARIRESRDALFGYAVDPIGLDVPLLAVDDSVSRFALVALMVEAMSGLLKLERHGQTVRLENMQWPGFSQADKQNNETMLPVAAPTTAH